ncbi:MAG: glycosyltransferase family 2 protein [Nitrospirota bacterium]
MKIGALYTGNKEREKLLSGLSIIIPAFNEEDGIGHVLEHLSKIMSQVDFKCEIIVVDDGSQDGTYEKAKQYDNIVLLRNNVNRGYGASIKRGIRSARYDLICITDADATYPNEDIPKLIDKIKTENADMVVGARIGKNVNIPLVRRPAKWVLQKVANLVSGQYIPDLNSGLRVFKKSVAMQFLSVLPNGFSFTTTITLALLTNGFYVEYIPINYHARIGNSKIRPMRDTINFLQLILRIALYFAPLKIFLPISGLLMLLGIFWGIFSKFVLGRFADTSTLIIVTSSIEVLVVGLLAELIDRRMPGYYKEE